MSDAIGNVQDFTREQSMEAGIVVLEEAARRPQRSRLAEPISALRAWPQIRKRLRAASSVALFLDFDGTLVGLEERPEQVSLPDNVSRLLFRLSRRKNLTVVIASGRRVRDLKRLIGLRHLRYFGVHGAERGGRLLSIPKVTRAALRESHRVMVRDVMPLRGVWVEPKGVSFAIHYRGADAESAMRGGQALGRAIRGFENQLRVLKGKEVWEVLPRQVVGKSAIVKEVMEGMPENSMAVYIGDDETDEAAFRALPDQITIAVGKRPDTEARYSLSSPSSVFRFLSRLEEELP